MKKIVFLFLVAFSATCFSQKNIPNINVTTLKGKSVSIESQLSKDKVTVLAFWATWCVPCINELDAISDVYEDWQDETGVNIIAVSIDDQRSIRRVAPYVNSVLWDYDVLLDPNKDFARAMQVVNVPHTFLVNGDGDIVWQHNNYSDGDEEEVYEQLLKWVE